MQVENTIEMHTHSGLSEHHGARASVLLCSDDDAEIRTMEGVFASLATYEISRGSTDRWNQGAGIESDAFDIIILDIGDGSVLDHQGFVQSLVKVSNTPIIFISESLNQERIRQLIKLDGADWLPKPLQPRVLIDTVNSITKRQHAGANNVHAVLPCGGGAGGSSVAIMLAYFLSRRRKRSHPSAALFDLDFSKADIGAYLNIENEFRLESVINNTERIDLEFINIIKKVHELDFTLFSFECPELPFVETGSELVLKMLDLVSFQHDHTVLDLSSQNTPWHANILAAVDTVTIVSGTSLPSLQRAKNLSKRLAQSRNSANGIQIVVNHVKSGFFGTHLGKKELLKLFDESTLTLLSEERAIMSESLNRGVLPLEVNKRSAFCSGVKQLSETIIKRVR